MLGLLDRTGLDGLDLRPQLRRDPAGRALLYVLACSTARRLGVFTGVTAAVFLCLSPRFFAHSFNNLRDIPETCLYAFAAIATYLAIRTGRLRWW